MISHSFRHSLRPQTSYSTCVTSIVLVLILFNFALHVLIVFTSIVPVPLVFTSIVLVPLVFTSIVLVPLVFTRCITRSDCTVVVE